MLVTALAITLATAACGSDVSGQPAAPGAGAPATAGAPGGTAKELNACTMLTADEVTPIIGNNNGGVPSTGFGECEWKNPDTSSSITVSIGEPGTAANGTVPPKEPPFTGEPGPDGTEFFAGGVDFVADNRLCSVFVVSDAGKEAETDTELRLVRIIRDRVQG